MAKEIDEKQRKKDLEIMNRIAAKSKLTQKDVDEISDKIKAAVAEKHKLYYDESKKFCILISKKDSAGLNIASQLGKIGMKESKDYFLMEEDSIYAENIDKRPGFEKFDFFIFATRHKSEKGTKTLTVHAPGNWNKADYGGQNGKICKTSGNFLKHLFRILTDENSKSESDWQVSLECTHHGPLLEKPCCFIEIGSSEKEWSDGRAGEILARVLSRALKEKVEKFECVVGIGGPHYCPNFNKLQTGDRVAVGHVIPGYALPLTEEMLKEAVEKNVEPVKKVIIDWKGCGKSAERLKVIEIVEKSGLKWERI